MTTTTKNVEIIKDVPNKKITVIRFFEAPVDKVWKAWTEPKLLDQWWAPKPWKAETKSMEFRNGGKWLYAMLGPEKEVQWCRVDYKTIDSPKNFTGDDYFCDETGKMNTDMPVMHWIVSFQKEGDSTKVTVAINFDSSEDLDTIVKMGFEEGFTAALGNLDEMFA